LDRTKEILKRVLDHYQRGWRPGEPDPFRDLIRIILSQNTSYKNQRMAFERLDKEIGVNPQSLAEANINEIASAIKPAGMFRQRAMRIKEVAHLVSERYGGDLRSVLTKGFDEAREDLMTLPGVGRKTADVLLLFSGGKKVIPIDRHIHRIAQRTGIVPINADYDEVRRRLEEAVEEDRYLDVHLFLIQFGREICRARSPRCDSCFLQDICPRIMVAERQSKVLNLM
jgi:endonuclease-3